MVVANIHIPTIVGYVGAVTLLVIGVSVGFSEKPTDSQNTIANKRLASTSLILISVLVAVLTYFINKEGGIANTWFGKKSSMNEPYEVPGVTSDAN